MRPAVCLISIALAGCSPLLGIEDPKARLDDAGPGDDAPIDAAIIDGVPIDGAVIDGPPAVDTLKISLGDIRVAQQQAVAFRVQVERAAGGTQDVTATAGYTTSNAAVALDGKGGLHGVQAGTATITATLAGATPASFQVTVTRFVCHPVINEFTTGTAPPGAGGDDEFIELFNPCTNDILIEGWTLNYRAASAVTPGAPADTHQLLPLLGTIAHGAFRVYGGSAYRGTATGNWEMGDGMQQNSGAIGLRDDAAALVDAVAYGVITAGHPFIETAAMAGMANDKSASRLPFDGKDDDSTGLVDGDNASDFTVVLTPTPGARNAP